MTLVHWYALLIIGNVAVLGALFGYVTTVDMLPFIFLGAIAAGRILRLGRAQGGRHGG